MWTSKFWRDAADRAVRTAVQSLLALFAAGVTILSIDWSDALAIAGTAGLLSVLMSLAAGSVGDPDSASLPGRHRKAE